MTTFLSSDGQGTKKKMEYCSWIAIFTSFVINIMEKSQKVSFWLVVKRFYEPIKVAKGNIIFWLTTGIYDGFQGIFAIQIGAMVVSAIDNKNIDQIIFLTILFLVMKLIANGTGPFAENSHDKAFIRINSHLNKKYLGKYIKLDNNSVEKIGTGKINEIVTQGTEKWSGLIVEQTTDIIIEAIVILYGFITIFLTVSFSYFLFFVFFFFINIFLIQFGYKKTVDTREKVALIDQDISRKRVQIFMSKFEILQNNKFSYESNILQGFFEKLIGYWMKSNLISEGMNSIASMLSHIVHASIYIIIGIGVVKGDFTISEFVLLTGVVTFISMRMLQAEKIIKTFHRTTIYIKQLWNTFDSIKTIHKDDNLPKFIFKSGNIKIHNMVFSYDKSPIFQSFDLELKGGTKTAFVGESGGGKTTLIKLLAGYIRPDNGEIEIDGQKLSKIKLTDYYKHIGYLTQDPSVFDGTIYENLVYALDTEPPKEDLEKIVKLAKCEFIREFGKGLETEIGERGVRLSGGQKQRLAIAKIMLKNPNIILLDEPTSALDSFNEEEISIALHNLFKGKTVIVVAHRLQTVKQANRILLVEQGKIIEDGTHDELVKLGGKYKKMLDLQSGF